MFNYLQQENIYFTTLNGSEDTDVENGLMETSWDELTSILMTHEYKKEKNSKCIIPAKFKDPKKWVLSNSDKPSYRNDSNIESISMAILDLDVEGAREQAEEVFKDFEYIMYSTHSYSENKPYKFRIVLKLKEPIIAEDWPKTFKSLISPIDADQSCGNLSRIFYLPTHNPESKLSPYSYHNEGKILSVEDIKNIQRKYESSLSPEQLAEYTKKNSSKTISIAKKHFSGEMVSYREMKNTTIDYSYEAMLSEFKNTIPCLRDDDNRHDFALRTIGKAVGKWGDKTDFFQLIQFIFKATTEYGTKPITDNSGNTKKELPEMVTSAIRKFSPELIDGPNPYIKNIREYIKDIILNVEKNALTNSWDFPSKIRVFNPMEKAMNRAKEIINDSFDNSLNGWRKRNLDKMKKYVRTGDFLQFTKEVINNEFSQNKGNCNISMLGQFLFYCKKGYSIKIEKSQDLSKDLNQCYSEVVDNLSEIFPKEFDSEQNRKFLTTSLKIARMSAIKDEWKFENEKKIKNDLTLTN